MEELHRTDVHSLGVVRVLGMPVLMPVVIVGMLFRVCGTELVCRKECDCGTCCDRENESIHFDCCSLNVVVRVRDV
jgi:hypothetical protein